MTEPTENRRIRFDPTVNLGHILTFLGFISLGIGAYQNLDKRVTVVEVRQVAQDRRDDAQDSAMKDSLAAVYASQRRIEDKLDALIAQRVQRTGQ